MFCPISKSQRYWSFRRTCFPLHLGVKPGDGLFRMCRIDNLAKEPVENIKERLGCSSTPDPAWAVAFLLKYKQILSALRQGPGLPGRLQNLGSVALLKILSVRPLDSTSLDPASAEKIPKGPEGRLWRGLSRSAPATVAESLRPCMKLKSTTPSKIGGFASRQG